MKKPLLILFTIIALLAIAISIFLSVTPKKPVENDKTTNNQNIQSANAKEFTITAKQWEFVPKTIEVNEGDRVKLIIQSTDVEHGIFIQEYNINEKITPGKTTTIEFTADKKGTFAFSCSVFCGIDHGNMKGNLIVS